MQRCLYFPFLALFGWLITACSVSQSTATLHTDLDKKACIERILSSDDSLGNIRNRACESRSLGATVTSYTEAMEKLNFETCPTDFTQAFTRHRLAWQKMVLVVDRYPDLRGEMHQLLNQIELSRDSLRFKRRLAAIWSTWTEVEQAASPFIENP